MVLAAVPAAAQMHKCVDARGVTHYTETPLPGCKGREVQIRPQAPIGTTVAPEADLGEQERAFRRRQLERAEAAQKSAADTKAREQRCQAARAELERLSSTRLFERNARGEREFLDDAATARRIGQQRDEVARACG